MAYVEKLLLQNYFLRYNREVLAFVVNNNFRDTIINIKIMIMNKILVWLSGKKSIIAGLITTTSAYLVSIGYINADTGAFIAAISLIIFGSASLATTRMIQNK